MRLKSGLALLGALASLTAAGAVRAQEVLDPDPNTLPASQDPKRTANGLALTPPMGWNSWNRFACNVGEATIRGAADAMAANGMKEAGYRYVVIDELHTYRGLFGSHVANVIRRLRRICNHYGADPVFICASATIANPAELAERILEAPVELVDDNGAPSGRKHVLVINPPVANEQLGIRASALLTGQRLGNQRPAPETKPQSEHADRFPLGSRA